MTHSLLTPASHPWLFAPDLQRLFAVFAAAGAEMRVVGGAVRNALMGLPISDIDAAVNRPPEAVEAVLQAAGIKTVRTGFAHGTLTAVLHGQGYEITSLRRDVSTDGRCATVAFSDDWAEDAARRDFTFNAIYAAADGGVFDYHGGVADAAAGLVRFIGVAEDRIREDYLRILRFFRFYAQFGRGDFDAEGVAACRVLATGMATLSRERVTQEFGKLLLASQPLPALRAMQEFAILPQVLPLTLDLDRLGRLLVLPEAVGCSLPVRLAALLPQDVLLPAVLVAALRLSVAEQNAVLALTTTSNLITNDSLPEALYRLGVAFCRGRLLMQKADDAATPLAALWPQLDNWRRPDFPLRGADLLAEGLEASPRLGQVLHAVEDWWIASGFTPNHAACRDEALRRWHNLPAAD